MDRWIKVSGVLYNLAYIGDIDEPLLVKGTPNYWVINYRDGRGNCLTWSFVTEEECKTTYQVILQKTLNPLSF